MRLTLQDAMAQAGLNPESLAQLSGVHRSTVYRLLANAIDNPGHATVRKLETALSLAPGSLLFGHDLQGATRAEARHGNSEANAVRTVEHPTDARRAS